MATNFILASIFAYFCLALMPCTHAAGMCGRPFVQIKYPPRQRIVRGFEAAQHSLPWTVSLRNNGGTFHFCGGTLVRVNDYKDESDIIITAGHCLQNDNPNQPNIDIVMGAHYRTRPAMAGEEKIPAVQIIMHPQFDQPAPLNDIAIVKLARPVKFSRTIQPACLPAPNETVADGTMGIAAGWGSLDEKGTAPDTLQQVYVPSMSSVECRRQHGSHLVLERILCAALDRNDRKGVCFGDSGGPYIFLGKDGYTLQGIPAWMGDNCQKAYGPDGYTRVAFFMDWIRDTIRRISSVQ